LLPADCIQVRMAGSVATPVWLGVEDYAWLRALIADFARLDGRRYREVVSFLREPPRTPAPPGKRRMAIWTIQDLCERERSPLDAGLLRDAVAVEAQRARDAGRFDRSRVLAAIEETAPAFAICSERIGLIDLFIDWAGRLPPSDPVHRRLAARKAGDEVRLRKRGYGIAIEARDGPIAMLSRPACTRWQSRLDRVVSVTLVEVIGRQAAQSAPQWRSGLRCDRWAVPVVDVHFAVSTPEPPVSG